MSAVMISTFMQSGAWSNRSGQLHWKLNIHMHCAKRGLVCLSTQFWLLPLQLSELPEHSLRQSQAATYRQPRGKRLPVREYKQVCVLTGPVSDMWQPVISSDWKIPATLQCKPSMSVIPAGSKLLRSQIHGGNCERALDEKQDDPQRTVECAIGIPWEPWEFIEQAKGHGHPKLFAHGVPKPLERTIQWIVGETPCNIAKYRSAVAMKWTSQAAELRDQEEKLKEDMPEHCKRDTGRKTACITGYYDQRSKLW